MRYRSYFLFVLTVSSHHKHETSRSCQQSSKQSRLHRCSSVCRLLSICAVVDLDQLIYRCLQVLDHVVHFFLRDLRIVGQVLCTCEFLDEGLCAFRRVGAQVKAVDIRDQLFQSAASRSIFVASSISAWVAAFSSTFCASSSFSCSPSTLLGT